MSALPTRHTPLELWGGVECTINRVGDTFRDQSALSGHDERPGDIDLFAGLGMSALRTAILWERISPEPGGQPDWRHVDRRMERLHALGIRPIAGLVHHGSGPRHTHLLDDGFAAGLARHAEAVAVRYPWIEEWTPVNEPLTTARFAALYGHWYPHARDEGSFWRALLNQVDGIRAAMRAVRRHVPHARLIQTDDLGRTYATPPLAAQAEFDNLRRWAGWDLLFGHVTPRHPLFPLLARHGLGDRARAIADDPCPPDVVGVNHYLTSDRFLDHRIERYPASLHGGNAHLAYADTEAVRVLAAPGGGLAGALDEAWDRYRVPIAVTEVHNGCTREEQMRWAAEAWDTADEARGRGIDIRAVTAWSLLGSHGWNTLLTADGTYESGVFDMSAGVPRATALAGLWRSLVRREARHPVASGAGWWRREERLLYEPHPSGATCRRTLPDDAAPLLICSADGVRGDAIMAACAARGIRQVWRSDPLDDETLASFRPWAVAKVDRTCAAYHIASAAMPAKSKGRSSAWPPADRRSWPDRAEPGIAPLQILRLEELRFASIPAAASGEESELAFAHRALDALLDDRFGD